MDKSDRRKVIGSFPSKTGSESLYYQQALPSKENVQGHLLVLHDLLDYHGRYQMLEEKLPIELRENLAISWLDFKGHGLSSGTRGHVDNLDEYVEDVDKFLGIFEEKMKKSSIPLLIFGQGLGGLVAIRYHQFNRENEYHSLKGMILVNPLIKLNLQFPEWLNLLFSKLESPLSHIKWPIPFSGEDFLTAQKEIESYDSDPLILESPTLGTMKEIQRVALEVSDSAYFFDFPCLFLVSDDDKLIDSRMTKLFAKGAPRNLRKIQTFKKARHDLLRESVRDKALKEVYNWLKWDENEFKK